MLLPLLFATILSGFAQEPIAVTCQTSAAISCPMVNAAVTDLDLLPIVTWDYPISFLTLSRTTEAVKMEDVDIVCQGLISLPMGIVVKESGDDVVIEWSTWTDEGHACRVYDNGTQIAGFMAQGEGPIYD